MPKLIVELETAADAERVAVAIDQLREGKQTHTGLLCSRLSRAKACWYEAEAEEPGQPSPAASPSHTPNEDKPHTIFCKRCGGYHDVANVLCPNYTPPRPEGEIEIATHCDNCGLPAEVRKVRGGGDHIDLLCRSCFYRNHHDGQGTWDALEVYPDPVPAAWKEDESFDLPPRARSAEEQKELAAVCGLLLELVRIKWGNLDPDVNAIQERAVKALEAFK